MTSQRPPGGGGNTSPTIVKKYCGRRKKGRGGIGVSPTPGHSGRRGTQPLSSKAEAENRHPHHTTTANQAAPHPEKSRSKGWAEAELSGASGGEERAGREAPPASGTAANGRAGGGASVAQRGSVDHRCCSGEHLSGKKCLSTNSLCYSLFKDKNILGLYVKAIVLGKPCVALLDTGASVSIVESGLIKDVCKVKGNKIRLSTAVEKMLITQGVANVPFKLGSQDIVHGCHVVDKLSLPGVDLILGLDYLAACLFVIDGRGEGVPRVFLNDNELKIEGTSDTTTAASVCNIGLLPVGNLYEETMLPPASLCNVRVNPSSYLEDGELVIVEPYKQYADYVLGGLSEVIEGQVRVPCINMTSGNIVLSTSICKLIPCDEGEGRVDLESESEQGEPSAVGTDVGQLASNVVASREERIFQLINANTHSNFVEPMMGLMGQFDDVIALDEDAPGHITHSPFRIDTGDNLPIRSRPYRIPVSAQEVVRGEIKKLEGQGIIQKSRSPWSSPIVLVKKKDGSPRLCVDYRRLNNITVDDRFPLPSIEELLVKVRGGLYFSTIDLKSGYHQIPVHPDDREKTAFICDDALYEYLYLPFGVKNAPSHFSRVMMAVLGGLIGSSVLVYLDDLIVLGRNYQEHFDNIVKVMEALGSQGMKINLKKCTFFKSEVDFLGHKVSRRGIEPCPDKVEAIHNYPTPGSSKEVASFLGLAGYYRKFIKGFGEIARPLEALKKKGSFKWGEEEEQAFSKLKEMLVCDQVLAYPKFDRPFFVTTDASNVAIGGVISQLDDEGRERPISFASRALKGAELNYSTLEKEALGILWVVERHRYILLGYPIHIKSDHRPLRDLFNKQGLNSRQSRWIERLLEFDIKGFEHVEGKLNKVADALSRHVCGVTTRAMRRRGNVTIDEGNSQRGNGNGELSPTEVASGDSGERATELNDDTEGGVMDGSPVSDASMSVGWNEEELQEEQLRESWINDIREYVMGKSSQFPSMVKVPRGNFVLEEGILYLKTEKRPGQWVFRVVLPTALHERALRLIHSCNYAGHLGMERTWRKARDAYFWVGLRASIKEFIANCHECSCAKPHATVCPAGRKWPIVPKKFYRVHMDLVGPFPTGSHGHKYVCVLVDAFTRYTFCYAMVDKSANSVADAIHYFIMKFGCPRVLISDNGREFVNEVIEGLTKVMGIDHFTIQSYRPSANGLVESHNRGIVQLLRLIVGNNPGNWVQALQPAEFALNTAYNRSIQDTPYFLVFGQDPVLPYSVVSREEVGPAYNIDDYKVQLSGLTNRVFNVTRELLARAREEYKVDYDARQRVGDPGIQAGERVYLKRLQPRKHKLEPCFVGPYRVIEVDKSKAKLCHLGTGKQVEYHLSHVLKKERDVTTRGNQYVHDPFLES